jgi:hypothetical protein
MLSCRKMRVRGIHTRNKRQANAPRGNPTEPAMLSCRDMRVRGIHTRNK